MQIARRPIGPEHPPFVIAELSGNHNQSLDRALALIDAAAAAGAHAVKLQTYTADTMTIACERPGFVIDDADSLWAGRNLYDLYAEAHTPWSWHPALFARARQLGLIPFSTPFDESAVDFLETLEAPCYKIASFEMTDLPLIRKVAATGKPMIVSTGMASLGEIDQTVQTARAAGCRDLILLKCTSSYPASPAHSHLRTLPHLRAASGAEVGLSDHTLGIGAAVAAVALGATVIEKHFTLCRADGGVDAAFSLEPSELKALVEESARAWEALGGIHYGAGESEKKSLAFRRSLYVVEDIAAGAPFTRQNLRAIRPGHGLSPTHLDLFLGRTARHDLSRGTPLAWEHLG